MKLTYQHSRPNFVTNSQLCLFFDEQCLTRRDNGFLFDTIKKETLLNNNDESGGEEERHDQQPVGRNLSEGVHQHAHWNV